MSDVDIGCQKRLYGSSGIPEICFNKEQSTSRGLTARSMSPVRSLDLAVKPREVGPQEFWKNRLYLIRWFFLLLSLLFILSCKSREEPSDSMIHPPRWQEAAAYHVQLGLAYLKQGDRVRAKQKLLLALAQDPHSSQANTAMGYLMEKNGDLGQAQKYYEKAIALAPRRGASLNNYGAFLCRRGQYRQAEKYFLQATQDLQYEHTAGAYENAGLCAMAVPNVHKAVYYFDKALAQDPTRVQSLVELVKIYLKQGKMQVARGYLKKYSDLTRQDQTLSAWAKKIASTGIPGGPYVPRTSRGT